MVSNFNFVGINCWWTNKQEGIRFVIYLNELMIEFGGTDWPCQFSFSFSDLFSSLDNLIRNAHLCTALRLTAIPSTSCNNFSMQGRTKWRNCRLSPKPPGYQLGWAILAECRQLDTRKHNFHFMY